MIDHMTGSEAVIAQLLAEGVRVVLSIPGGHNLPICNAALDHPELRFIACRHEQEMAFIANGFARASGKIAVPLVITGPGVGNCITPLADAYVDSVPMVVIATHVERRLEGRGAFHELKDQTALLGSVTKWNTRVEQAEEIPDAIRTSFRKAYENRPGPTAVEIPVDLQTQRAAVNIYPSGDLPMCSADPAAVTEAARRLTKAQKPLLYVGNGANSTNCSSELIQLMERLQAPCFTTALAKGVVPEDHPLSLGWGWVERGPARPFLQEADAVLVVGSSLDEVETQGWTLPLPQELIQIDTCREMIGRNYPASVALVGNAKRVLAQLLQEVPPTPSGTACSRAIRIDELKSGVLSRVRQKRAWQFVNAIQEALPRDAIVTNDACIANGWVMCFLKRYLPRTFNLTRSMAALGYAFPAAMGAKLAYPDRQTVAVLGDGGFLFSDHSLATAVQYGISAVAVVFNNNCYGSIKRKQEHQFGRTIGVELHNPDFVALAQAYGAAGTRAEEPEQLYDALTAAWSRKLPTLIEVPLEMENDYF
ncbi:MAG TPA: thiamine pyrophosphate-binding protein [Acidobacteriota bacterium]|jgi:acetolactate synthase-1/2/3 large subunit|nr:thiamine pyrophosphate-binding protein [Acidobacteriota bacterium]